MRVWALASCSGLLALAACSAEQSSPPDLGTTPPDGDDTAEVKAQPGLRATSSSPVARPELRARLDGLNRARFSPRSTQASPLASRSGGAGQTVPQAEQLRARLQRLRTQNRAMLSSNTPIATAPLPAALTATPPRPVPQAAVEPPSETILEARSAALPAPPSAAEATALPTLPQPNGARPNVAAPELGLSSTASTAIALGPVASARPTDSYSIALARHQGYSARSQQPAPVITTASTQLSAGLTARLHGATPSSPADDATVVVAAQPSSPAELPAASAPAPALAEAAIPETAPLATAGTEVSSAPESADANSSTTHQSSATLALTLTPQSAAAPASLTHHSLGRAARPTTATAPQSWSATTAPPESLPLNQGTPRLSPLRSAAALTVPEAALPEAAEAQPSATQTSETGTSEARILEPQIPSPAFSSHQGQSQPESLSLSPQPPATTKDLPAAYCLRASGLQANGLSLNPEAQAESEPQGSERHLDQLSTLVRAGSADAALVLGEGLNKAEPAVACLEVNEAAADPAAAESSPAIPLN
ncbi:hypothetical protein ACQ4N7_01590 [Nodosilinea sp. AN01ver1]|uniref:hypothetical protein n=1 Tax=Nodosilinea sp. AN01ver1 TaxID=3423362 RepID=UPI003D318A37